MNCHSLLLYMLINMNQVVVNQSLQQAHNNRDNKAMLQLMKDLLGPRLPMLMDMKQKPTLSSLRTDGPSNCTILWVRLDNFQDPEDFLQHQLRKR